MICILINNLLGTPSIFMRTLIILCHKCCVFLFLIRVLLFLLDRICKVPCLQALLNAKQIL